MSSHSPQRPRKPQGMQVQNQGPMHTIVPPRESSPSPSFQQRPRGAKTNSLPAVLQVFNNTTQQTVQSQQSSPPTSARRSPQLPVGQIQRCLPTPPHPNPPMSEQTPERRMNSPPPQQTVNTHYPRPVNKHLSSQFLASFQGVDDNLHMTDELLADIERADMQRSQGFSYPAPYPVGFNPPGGKDHSSPPAKDPNVERFRNTGKSSPKDARHRPQSRDRKPGSPMNQPQNSSHTPERRSSPNYSMGSAGETSSTYVSHSQRSPLSLSMPAQSPPALMTVRTPDKSLPVQEEPEEDNLHVRSRSGSHEWIPHESDPGRRSSPTPSSDLHPEGNSHQRPYREDTVRTLPNGRNSRAGHREDDDETLIEHSVGMQSGRDDSEGHTPRSPTTGLPEVPMDRFQQLKNPVPVPAPRGRGRTGATDQLGLRTLNPSLMQQTMPGRSLEENDEPPQYVESRSKPSPQQHERSQPNARDLRGQNIPRYYTPQMLEDFMSDPTTAYLHALMGASPRPDAPIPPTPHSQTSPPSPSPGSYDPRHELPPFSPVVPVGSPYPYPFTHVRRNTYHQGTNRSQALDGYENIDLNHPSVISEQMKKQYQMYAQNNLGGHISDSTFTPASTPFPPNSNYFNQWAHWHTQKLLGGDPMNIVRDPMSLRSSPSHEPVALPPPPSLGLRKKDTRLNLRRAQSIGTRKPPPRVDSTQPRDTSPEPSSSSGESTAGEDHVHQQQFSISEEGNWVSGALPSIVPRDDDSGDWIDEIDDEDEDLLELEFHPSYVNNVEKRRRRWETKWDALLQAFQAVDRQTDATLLLLAAPSHSSKLHLVTSRSIRRHPSLARSPLLSNVRASFRQMAVQRKNIRSLKSSLVDHLLMQQNGSSSDESAGSSEGREEDLRRALGAALGSLGALNKIYEHREARWKEEMSRIAEDREKVELLLRQALGERHSSNSPVVSGQTL